MWQAVVAEPADQCLTVGHRGFPEAEELANLGSVVLDRAPLPVVLQPELWGEVELLGHVFDHGLRHVPDGPRKSALVLEGFQQHCKREPRRSALAQCLLFFVWRQGPVLDELIGMPVAFHGLPIAYGGIRSCRKWAEEAVKDDN
jgi:hypothetical protein